MSVEQVEIVGEKVEWLNVATVATVGAGPVRSGFSVAAAHR